MAESGSEKFEQRLQKLEKQNRYLTIFGLVLLVIFAVVLIALEKWIESKRAFFYIQHDVARCSYRPLGKYIFKNAAEILLAFCADYCTPVLVSGYSVKSLYFRNIQFFRYCFPADIKISVGCLHHYDSAI